MADTKTKVTVLQSIKDLKVTGPSITLDLNDDAWSFGAPPPDGFYDFKWFLAKDGIIITRPNGEGSEEGMYSRISCEGHLINNSEWDDTVGFLYLDSRVFRGKGNSTMAGFIQKAGGQKYIEKLIGDKNLNVNTLSGLAEAILRKEPIIKAETAWRGQYDWTPEKGENAGVRQYVGVHRNMKSFPNNSEKPGEKLHIYEYPASKAKDGISHEIRAQLQVLRLLGKNEAMPTKLVSQPKQTKIVQPLVMEEVEVETAPTIAKIASNVEDDESMQLMLE
jgi:predicted transcriptional regulator